MGLSKFELIFVFLIIFSFSATGASYMNCIDSDGGQIFNVKGDVNYTYASVPMQGDWMTYSDYCSYISSPITECTGSNCFVTEYSCTGSNYNYEVQITNQNCTELGYEGCRNGACYGFSASCSDQIKNQTETDVDCGGICGATCELGEHCLSHSDCVSYYCNDEVCSTAPASDAHCYNGVQDLDESGIDCGGAYCNACVSVVFERGSNDPGNHYWNTSENPFNVMYQLTATASNGVVELYGINISGSGSGDELNDIESAFVALDNDSDGKYNELTDTLIGKSGFNADNGKAMMDFQPMQSLSGSLTVSESRNFIIGYKMKSSPENNETFRMQIDSVQVKFPSTNVFENVLGTEYFSNTKTVSAKPKGNCFNGVQDLDESGIDCGGAYCPECKKPDPRVTTENNCVQCNCCEQNSNRGICISFDGSCNTIFCWLFFGGIIIAVIILFLILIALILSIIFRPGSKQIVQVTAEKTESKSTENKTTDSKDKKSDSK
ncbi:MAG: hypothetical protein JW703_04030 [Candidatus Diapherotrites archaeon]|nr:hypothetical protein [Candidatus Diapherotrites archaeon]